MTHPENRAERRNKDKKIIKNRLRLLKKESDDHRDMSGKTYYEHMAEEPNRLNKKHPYDCGKAKCMLCHSEKILGHKKIQDKRQTE